MSAIAVSARARWVLVWAVACAVLACADSGQEEVAADEKETRREITFASKDGLEIGADLYLKHADEHTPFIVLFHQARSSRGEYREIAERLNELGFNCLAIDQRSGGAMNEVANETAERAREGGKEPSYLEAEQDLIAALEHARAVYAKGKVLAWGSSYSASLALRVAAEQPKLVDGLLCFAPGEYFERLGKPADWIQAAAKSVECPVFVTSARSEAESWKAIFDALKTADKTSFLPETEGNHGSKALWQEFEDSAGYWKAVEAFLGRFLQPR
ncbi:MAG: alpha/beta hydrolase [Planctomycetes bacterium]|nr:alpha/beta hydrolase [Planctomycetota bacterium]